METIVLIGATGEFGQAIGKSLLKKGFDVLAVARGITASAELELLGARLCRCDIAADSAIESIRAELKGDVRAVIHGPGVATTGGVMSAPIASVVGAANIKVGGMMRAVRACHDRFTTGTRLIGIGGHYGFEPTAYASAAGVGNAALANLMKQYSLAYGDRGISAHLIAPGPANTDRLRRVAKAKADRDGKSLEQVLEELRSESAMGEFTDVHSIVWAVDMLLSPHADAMTGSTLFFDVGRRRGIP